MIHNAALAALVLMTGCVQAAAAPIGFSELMARPRETPNETIHFGKHAHQFGELWLPAGKGPFATIVVVHGGCWLAELPGPELMAYMSAALRDRGYAVWSFDYRRIGDEGGGYPGTFLDAASAMDILHALAKKHPLDLSRVVAVGHSAGGHLVT
ncbi:MAG: alpha/beta hydrolase [Micropepsaceae bacterium]